MTWTPGGGVEWGADDAEDDWNGGCTAIKIGRKEQWCFDIFMCSHLLDVCPITNYKPELGVNRIFEIRPVYGLFNLEIEPNPYVIFTAACSRSSHFPLLLLSSAAVGSPDLIPELAVLYR